jgi:hypothetical protein
MERFNLKKLIDVAVKEQNQVKMSNRFAALENLDDDVDINRAWESIRENMKDRAREAIISLNSINHGLISVDNY